MKGLELSRRYWREVGRPALERDCPQVLESAAAGLAGEGSECFGYDDVISRDHDWGPGFCLWLDRETMARWGREAAAVYARLPPAFLGFRRLRPDPMSAGRVGVLETGAFYRRFFGLDRPPETLAEWRSLPETGLAAATNGAVFEDQNGTFTAFRRALLAYYPEDLRRKKLAARCALAAQSGQYNYARCRKRGDRVAALLALAQFIDHAQAAVFLLNRRYRPYYKWAQRALEDLPLLGRTVGPLLRGLAGEQEDKTGDIEAVSALLIGELESGFPAAPCPGDPGRYPRPGPAGPAPDGGIGGNGYGPGADPAPGGAGVGVLSGHPKRGRPRPVPGRPRDLLGHAHGPGHGLVGGDGGRLAVRPGGGPDGGAQSGDGEVRPDDGLYSAGGLCQAGPFSAAGGAGDGKAGPGSGRPDGGLGGSGGAAVPLSLRQRTAHSVVGGQRCGHLAGDLLLRRTADLPSGDPAPVPALLRGKGTAGREPVRGDPGAYRPPAGVWLPGGGGADAVRLRPLLLFRQKRHGKIRPVFGLQHQRGPPSWARPPHLSPRQTVPRQIDRLHTVKIHPESHHAAVHLCQKILRLLPSSQGSPIAPASEPQTVPDLFPKPVAQLCHVVHGKAVLSEPLQRLRGGMRLSGPEVWRIPQQQIQHRKEYILLRLVISEVDLFLDVVLS